MLEEVGMELWLGTEGSTFLEAKGKTIGRGPVREGIQLIL